MKITIHDVNPNKLHDEIISANITPLIVENDLKENEYIAENTWVSFENGTDMELAQQIINAHDPTPMPPVAGQDEFNLDVDFRLTMIELGVF